MRTIDKGKAAHMSDIEDQDELDEEPGEVIESAPPLKVGEERLLGASGLKKKLIKQGQGWETPEPGDEVIVHYVGTLLDGTEFDSTRDRDEPVTFKVGHGHVVPGLDQGILTMRKGEIALFTIPHELGYGAAGGRDGVPPDAFVLFEVELVSWITVVDICKDGGIIKKIMEKGDRNKQPSDLDEVIVKYQVALVDSTIVAKTPGGGVGFYVKDGHFCQALPKAIVTMKQGEKVKLVVQPQYAFGKEGDSKGGIQPVPPNSVLNIDLELVSFKPVIDVTGDSKVMKKILREGEGTLVANEGAVATISYTAMLEDGTVFEKKELTESSLWNLSQMKVHLSQILLDLFLFLSNFFCSKTMNTLRIRFSFIFLFIEQVVTGLDQAAMTMKKGEWAMLTIDHDYGFGDTEVKKDLAIVPPFSKLVYEVEMLDFIKEKTPWEMNNQEKIEAAWRKKEEGNLLFKNEKYQRAGRKYEKAADYVSEDGSFGDEEQKLVKALRVSCWLNGAACSLKLSDFQGAIKLCSKVSCTRKCY
ncbi:FKBP-type peptidyl-prolyl cis-trans isomerase family protein [Tripterygium wilfordii]|uniref:peptidylprolyl isomerase n=1 Tax=Tripterygium wilfordii TaxID=458696 RepID=A0A7J7D2N6_TRIWF|nr:FKBP-type peptidyl-prolyl cis-trans isomerase family protein [Tripterygium wilfordii]